MQVNTEGPLDANIMFVGEAPGCFIEDVEALTQAGWYPISLCTTEIKVAQYDKGNIEFVYPTNIINEHFSGKVTNLNGLIETSVTNNHKFLLYNKYHKNFIVEEADKLRLKYPEQAFIISGSKCEGIDVDDNLIKLICATQADGSYAKTGIQFEFTKQRKIIRLLTILATLGVSYRIGEENKRGTFRLTIPNDEPMTQVIQQILPDKIFTWGLLALNARSLNILLEELKYWDGSSDSRNSSLTSFEYTSSIKQNTDIIQAIAHLTNHKAVVAEHTRSLRVSISDKCKIQVTGINSTSSNYSGQVYCITVPSGFFVVRSRGKVFITGNSEEDKTGRPFQGYAGGVFDNLLGQAGIARYQCLITNVARERPPANRISYYFEDKKCTIPKPNLVAWIVKLKEEIELYKPNIIVALGVTALWALTEEKKISDFRGYIIPCTLVLGQKVLATYHPSAVGREWKLYFQTVLDLRKALRHSNYFGIPKNEQIFIPNANVQQFITYMEELIAKPELDKLSIDIETVQPGSHIEELGISHDPNFGMSIFLLKGRAPALSENDELRLWQTFDRLVSCKKNIMQNGAYDTGVLWYNNHIFVENLWMDTLIAAHICWPELPRDLGFLGSVCLDVEPWKNTSKSSVYNPADAANTFGIAKVLDKELDKQKIRATFDFEMSLIPVALMMQLQGVEVNKEKQKELIEEWSIKRTELKEQLFKVIGKEINFNSPKQMQQLLYFDLGLPIQYKRRKSVKDTRTMTTDANALRTLSRLVPDNPVFNLILEYKKANTLVNNFLDITLSPEGRVHTSYNITGATSDDEEDTKKTKRSFGRWSSSASIILPYGSGNLQNIPPVARQMYTAPPGWKIIQADYSQAEAVVVAYIIGDQKLKKMFKDSFGLSKLEKAVYDIHKMTIAHMLHITMEEVTAEQRKAGKTIRHAVSYSAGPQVLANRLGIKLSAAKTLMELYHNMNPALRAWYMSIQQELKLTRTLTNLLGRKHRFLDRWGDELFRSAYSYIPQSTVGDLLNVALKRLYDALKDLPFELIILMQLHDAIYTLVKEEHVDEAIKCIRKAMIIPLQYKNEEFTIDADFTVGDSWAEGKSVEINWKEK